jgi:hypothetical protein
VDDNQWTGDDGDGWMMAAADLKMMRFRVMVMASSIVNRHILDLDDTKLDWRRRMSKF